MLPVNWTIVTSEPETLQFAQRFAHNINMAYVCMYYMWQNIGGVKILAN